MLTIPHSQAERHSKSTHQAINFKSCPKKTQSHKPILIWSAKFIPRTIVKSHLGERLKQMNPPCHNLMAVITQIINFKHNVY